MDEEIGFDLEEPLELDPIDDLPMFDIWPASALPVRVAAPPMRLRDELRTAPYFGNDVFARLTKRTYMAICQRNGIELTRTERRNRRLIEDRLEHMRDVLHARWAASPELRCDVQRLILAQAQPVLQPPALRRPYGTGWPTF
jgi:hypothetical protein